MTKTKSISVTAAVSAEILEFDPGSATIARHLADSESTPGVASTNSLAQCLIEHDQPTAAVAILQPVYRVNRRPGVTKNLLSRAVKGAHVEKRVRQELERGGVERLDELREIGQLEDDLLDPVAVEARRLYAFKMRSPDALCAWAGGLRNRGRLVRAEAVARKATEMTTIDADPAPWITMGGIQRSFRVEKGRRALRDSIRLYQEVLVTHPRNSAALVGLAAVWLDMHEDGDPGALEKAGRCIRDSGVTRPQFARILNRHDRIRNEA